MIEVAHLSKSYGLVRAVDDVSFRVDKGEIVGFLGPNGAGKSTTLRILAGFLGATTGKVTIAGHDIANEAIEARAKIGYMPETSPLYPEMRVAEYLRFRAELKRVPRRARAEAVARVLVDTKIEDVADATIGHLSKGYRQRVGLADALVGAPPLLILDEPTAGLDPNQIREVRDLIRRLGKDHTVFVSTHILSEVEATCTRAIVIARGRLVAEGSIDELRARRLTTAAVLTIRGEPDAVLALLRGQARALRVDEKSIKRASEPSNGESVVEVRFDSGTDAPEALEELVRALVQAGHGVRGAQCTSSLEQVFSELTTGKKKEAAS